MENNFQQMLSTLAWFFGWVCFFVGIVKLSLAYRKKADPAFSSMRNKSIKFLFSGVFLLGFLAFQIGYDGVIIDAKSGMPPESSMAPGFTLPNQDGKTVSLERFRGKWVVLYFYPKDFTSGCSVEAHNFQEDLPKYVAKNATIVGVSTDEPGSHKSFCAKEGLNFTLLSDTEHQVITLYGSKMNFGGATLAARNTFLIDPKGLIRKVYVNVSPSSHSAEVLGDLEAMEIKTNSPATNPE
ncbi:MAG: peroxiredoxin [Alphaproteobacteria bacterium]